MSSDEEYDSDDEVYESKNIIYEHVSDGLTYDQYNNAANKHNMRQSECCHKYFFDAAYVHENKYGFNVAGIKTCIHCFFNFNTYKMKNNCEMMTQKEKECLTYYIDNFTEHHDKEKCTRRVSFGDCILCDAYVGKIPKFMKKNIIKSEKSQNSDYVNHDVNIIEVNNTDEYILCI